jgi:ABC-type transport system substrate-binding protein
MLRASLRALSALLLPVPMVIAGTQVTSAASELPANTVLHAAATGKTLTIASPEDILGWDPSKNQGTYESWPYQAVYDTLIRCNAQGQVEPDIALSFTSAAQNTTFTAQIRPGMKFSDGTPVNAQAVQKALQYLVTNANGNAYLGGLSISAPGPMTVVIKAPSPDPALPQVLCGGTNIASPKYLASGHLNGAPVGSGPYTYDASASTPGASYTFVKNPSYWDPKDFPFSTVVVKIIASPTATIDALKTGQIAGAPIPSNLYSEAVSSGLKVVALPGETTRLVLADHTGKVVPALGNLDVRRAINMVFNKNAIAKDLYQGRATPTDQIPTPSADGYIKGLQDPYPYNVAQARGLMAKAGFAKGFTVDLPFIEGVGLDTLMPVVIQELSQINIKVHEVTLTGPNEFSELLSGKYPMLIWPLGNYGNTLDDMQGTIVQKALWNVEHQPNATIQALYNKMAVSSGAQYVAYQQAIYRYTIQQAWFVPIVYNSVYYAYNSSDVSIPTSSDPADLNPLLIDFELP